MIPTRVTRRLEKNRPNFGKSSPMSCQTKKWHNLLHYPPSELYKYRQQIICLTKKISGHLKSSPNGEISPNLVTLIPTHPADKILSKSFNYKKRLVSRINPSLVLEIILYNYRKRYFNKKLKT